MATDQERADVLGVQQIDGANKLDHFIMGISVAICAYLAQTNPYAQLGVNKETFLLLSLLIFAASCACGFQKLEARSQLALTNASALGASSGGQRAMWLERGALHNKRCQNYNHIRNYLLLTGLLCYLVTKVWATYQNTGWIMLH
ncbi:hypothetical protein MO767_18825 [Pseudomonas sp. UYIF39]|uniref:hypothetical protein n=1 Tax=Pseudomonas sp. UYIF39 TaxID=1630747 RepID=UPI00249EB279|nr:hypothetical protein [Pseudomonas sp. UYIF39]MDI3356382.1 hypothetical protein [Pseudomonas sp. UYIF39]